MLDQNYFVVISFYQKILFDILNSLYLSGHKQYY